MSDASLQRVLDAVRRLTPEQRRELRDRLDAWPDPPPPPANEAETQRRLSELDRRLLAKGLIQRIPPPITDLAPYRGRRRIDVQGTPLSQTVIEDRR
ncbi:MAG TPA: hypothetical protein VF590_20470 [Isosphaeraceae bacterium]